MKHMWDTCTSHFGPKKFDRFGRGGQGRYKYCQIWASFLASKPSRAPKWVHDPGNGLKSIRGNWGDHFCPLKSDLGLFWPFWGPDFIMGKNKNANFSKSPHGPIFKFFVVICEVILQKMAPILAPVIFFSFLTLIGNCEKDLDCLWLYRLERWVQGVG